MGDVPDVVNRSVALYLILIKILGFAKLKEKRTFSIVWEYEKRLKNH